MKVLEIENLTVAVDEKEVLRDLSFEVRIGEVHALMGTNGAGKSTLGNVVAGRPGYTVRAGSIKLCGEPAQELQPEERAQKGLFLGFQYPIEIPGVSNIEFLRAAYSSLCKAKGTEPEGTGPFMKRVRAIASDLGLSNEFLRRGVNDGFSGGEKKRNEVLQMLLLRPKLAILDETDSGLDVDALQTVADGINGFRSEHRSIVLITHYQRLLSLVQPDFVHVVDDGTIVCSGDTSLAERIEREGFGWLQDVA